MKTNNIVIIICLGIFGGCTQPADDSCRLARVESFVSFNMTPNEDSDKIVQNNIKVLGQKAYKKYSHKLITYDYVSASSYKKKHPDDALLISEFLAGGTRTVYVFTNKPPDKEFFDSQ